ncbi:gluconokinase, GntK/IdnK-type [Thalassomonas sp. M1454]|uniref:gluconokinase, GntK/IdnK-type n=1 Tax=Thalassomonas sp. M1454 TaxID=2594477 RepID=UPI00117DF640|nr:gluconokinase, GntK/IdnK-type [Thalassomonas sp. M1454]TRX53843.1 AAA family ATPase [Thalassomonas sp. M1454]
MENLNKELLSVDREQHSFILNSATQLPQAGSFLWNKVMMLQMNCRGYAVGQFMQPEPSKYSFAPNIEAKTFMQPEHNYYADHPGRFFYIKDEDSGQIFSAPFEPTRAKLDKFEFCAGQADIKWHIENLNIQIDLTLNLAEDDAIEMWQLAVTNLDDKPRNISIYPYFTIGYMSWMNQSAEFLAEHNTIVATCISPYQKVEEYFKRGELNDKTYLIAETPPFAWCCNQNSFTGEGGIANPDGINCASLDNMNALYEVPSAVMQYREKLVAGASKTYRFLFGPAKDNEQVVSVKQKYFSQDKFCAEKTAYQNYIAKGQGVLNIDSGDTVFDEYVNHWLPRQVYYHGDVNRLTTDPQTRNYLQDALGMSYINSAKARAAFITALGQQSINGSMPDGILIHPEASLKYINQVPHADHCVWLPICLQAYFNETNDSSLLTESIKFADSEQKVSLKEHVELALDWLINACDQRGLSYIAQGDWCDPMNMVGYKGKGVSTWLTLASAYAINCWLNICRLYNLDCDEKYSTAAAALNAAVNKHCWDGQWYSRGITDDNISFGIRADHEGRIFLNPQSWALLAGAANKQQQGEILGQIQQQLDTPFGTMMLAPSYTKMREDVGRVTQKFPGTAENGSIYNHAAVFYAYSLYQIGEGEKAYQVLRKMLPDDDLGKRGQLPNFIPNYYRGAYYQHPERAGRSSQLFNTGTVSWVYRCIIEGLAGLQGQNASLTIKPQLPSDWQKLSVKREYLGATFNVDYQKTSKVTKLTIEVDGEALASNEINNIQPNKQYNVQVLIPENKVRAEQKNLYIVMGVSGCGKTTVAKTLSQHFNYHFVEADDFHSEQAKAYMQQGVALTDEQRLPWIELICSALKAQYELGNDCVLAYSGLRAEHREKFKQLGFNCQFIYLKAEQDVIATRLTERESHFFNPTLLASQFASLQSPEGEADVLTFNANQAVAPLCQQIIKAISNSVTKENQTNGV